MQKLTDGEEEEDGKDECSCVPFLTPDSLNLKSLTMTDIVTSDDKIIQDNVSLLFFSRSSSFNTVTCARPSERCW